MIQIGLRYELAEALRGLQQLNERLQTKTVRSALVTAIAPLKKDVKETAPEDMGYMKKAIGHLQLNARQKARIGIPSEMVALIVGANRKIEQKWKEGTRKVWQGRKAYWEEYGTKHRSADPFLDPALSRFQTQLEPRFYDALMKHIGRLAERA